MVIDGNTTGTTIRGFVVALMWILVLWRGVRRYRGDQFIEIATITIFAFILTITFATVPGVPEWLFNSSLILTLLLWVLTTFYLFRDTYRAMRRYFKK